MGIDCLSYNMGLNGFYIRVFKSLIGLSLVACADK